MIVSLPLCMLVWPDCFARHASPHTSPHRQHGCHDVADSSLRTKLRECRQFSSRPLLCKGGREENWLSPLVILRQLMPLLYLSQGNQDVTQAFARVDRLEMLGIINLLADRK